MIPRTILYQLLISVYFFLTKSSSYIFSEPDEADSEVERVQQSQQDCSV